MQRCLSRPRTIWDTPMRSSGQVRKKTEHLCSSFIAILPYSYSHSHTDGWGSQALHLPAHQEQLEVQWLAKACRISKATLPPEPYTPLSSFSSSTVRAYTLSEVITIAIVAIVVVVAVVGGVIGCAVRARSYRSAEALEPLLGETFRRYSQDDRRLDKSQSVVWTNASLGRP